MRQERYDIMGMPVSVEIADDNARPEDVEEVFAYLRGVDEKFSTYKKTSEITAINKGLPRAAGSPAGDPAALCAHKCRMSEEMREVFRLAEETKKETNGYFDIRRPDGTIDPSGIVKGWAIKNAADLLAKRGHKNFFVEAGGDIEARGANAERQPWRVGIRNPFQREQIVKILRITNRGVATSGTAARGQHVYNPHKPMENIADIVSITVIGPNIYEADRFATAAFAMGREGIRFIENLKGFEAYMIDAHGIATMTAGFEHYV